MLDCDSDEMLSMQSTDLWFKSHQIFVLQIDGPRVKTYNTCKEFKDPELLPCFLSQDL